MQNKTVIVLSTAVYSEINLTQTHVDWSAYKQSWPVHIHDQCVLLTPAGQLSQVGRQFYNTDIEVEILSKEETEKMTYVVCTRAQVKNQTSCWESDLDPVSVLSVWKWFHRLQLDDWRRSCLRSNNKCLLDGDKCLLAWLTQNLQQNKLWNVQPWDSSIS